MISEMVRVAMKGLFGRETKAHRREENSSCGTKVAPITCRHCQSLIGFQKLKSKDWFEHGMAEVKVICPFCGQIT